MFIIINIKSTIKNLGGTKKMKKSKNLMLSEGSLEILKCKENMSDFVDGLIKASNEEIVFEKWLISSILSGRSAECQSDILKSFLKKGITITFRLHGMDEEVYLIDGIYYIRSDEISLGFNKFSDILERYRSLLFQWELPEGDE